MRMKPSTSSPEITESNEEFSFPVHSKIHGFPKPRLYEVVGIQHGDPVKNDLVRLFEALDIKAPSRFVGKSQHGVDLMQENVGSGDGRVSGSHASGIGVSKSVSLKQALRRLCVSHASEMAALKRLSKPVGLSGVSEAGTIRRLYAAIIVQAGEDVDKEREDMLEISVVPNKKMVGSPERAKALPNLPSPESSNKTRIAITKNTVASKNKVLEPKTYDSVAPTAKKTGRKISAGAKTRRKGKARYGHSLPRTAMNCEATECNTTQSPPIKPVVKSKCSSKIKEKASLPAATVIDHNNSSEVNNFSWVNNEGLKDEPVQASDVKDTNASSCSAGEVSVLSKVECTPSTCNGGRMPGTRVRKSPRSRTKGEYSHSSKSSLGDFSSSTSFSNESNQSSSSGLGSRPHMSKDVRWIAIRSAEKQHGSIGLKNFTLLKRLGCGDIGTVYLAELTGSETLFALKIMDNEYLMSRKKMLRAETERDILLMLDHPFLPTLYTHFISDNLSCLVMEYCPGGDLHVLRQQQPGRCFNEPAARFYVAEVLLALEYLHMLGVIYRDLKPENILVREDGHIMLSDFDLSLRCSVNPTLLRSSSLAEAEAANKLSGGPCVASSCIDPLCLQPSWAQVSCFTNHSIAKNKKVPSDPSAQVSPLPQLVAEPTEARSNSFVGTHEYLAPEIIKGEGHGSSVDWWTFGIFLYELLFGRTPFKGPGNEETLTNIVYESLMFPECPNVSFQAVDLIRGLLVKEPENRLGSVKGAAEIKRHAFFKGLNWALIRCAVPPEVPVPHNFCIQTEEPSKKKEGKCLEFGATRNIDFELF